MSSAAVARDRVLASAPRSGLVFVVDDDTSIRESLDALITSAGWRCETFASASRFLEHQRAAGPSCLVLDVNLPGVSGLDLQQRIAPLRAELPIIFITGFADVASTVKAMKAGAIEFLTKPLPPDVLLRAVANALEQSRRAIRRKGRRERAAIAYQSLSRRERQVMALVVRGRLNKQIAAELCISEITVKAHRGRVMRKMRASSLPHLVKLAGRLGLWSSSSRRRRERSP